MANIRLHRYRHRSRAVNLTNYAIVIATTILVLITAHAKSAHLNEISVDAAQATAITDGPTTTRTTTIAPATSESSPTQLDLENTRTTTTTTEGQVEEGGHHHHKSKHHHAHHNHDEHQRSRENHQQQHHHNDHHQEHLGADGEHPRKHHSHRHSHNMLQSPATTEAKHPYHSKFTIEELLNTKFERKISNDIDMDPCKARGFMGDIALPDVSYGDPIVAFTPEWQPQADAPADPSESLAAATTTTKFNKTFQQELEILKQEVYHEGLQVEEEGLTDIIRKKTKLPSSSSSNNENPNERSKNDPILLANELVKPSGFSSEGSDYLLKNLKNEIISQRPQQPTKENGFPTETEYFEPKISIREKPISVVVDETATAGEKTGSNGGTSANRGTEGSNSNNNEMDVVGKLEPIVFLNGSSNGAEAEKLNKSATNSAIRNVDHRKIQSDTKDIEDDSGNNFVSERKVVILPTSLPTQRSTLPNVYSNAGGNGMKLDDVEFLHSQGAVRRRHRRGRKNRRSSDSADYSAKLQRLREELNRPVRTVDDVGAMRNRHRYMDKNAADSIRFDGNRASSKANNNYNNNHKSMNNTNAFGISNLNQPSFHWHQEPSRSHPLPHPDPHAEHHNHQQQQQQQQHHQQQHHHYHQHQHHLELDRESNYNGGAAKSFNYSSELSDELDVLTKRKYTMDALNAEVQASFESEDLQSEESLRHLEHHHRMARAVTAKKERVWDYGVIPYEIDGNFSGLHKALFKQAMRHWENFTCIKFVERDPEIHPNYIVFTVRSCGCCSFVGKRGNGPQAISIGRNCDKFGIVVHELGHVVGFWHEHTRPDREKHVVIELNNIMKGQDYNFNKLTPEEVDSLGMAYDYDSIMHYARNTFSKGTYLDTILPIEVKGKKRPEIGQRLRLSVGDIAQANLLYKCPKCGRTFQESTGAFASPSYYTAGAQSNETERCEWRITATHGERIVLRLETLNLLKSDKCQTDYLEIRDGYYFKSPLIGRYCGKSSGEVVTTTSSRMLLTYVNSHRAEGHRGFKAEFETICGGELSVDDSEGRLESPNYPLDYLANKECIWKITVPKGYQVALKFHSFEVENHDSCVYDFVEVHDGPSQDSPLVGVFCGYKPPPHMKSSGNTMFVKFVSDTSVQKAGFSAVFMKEVDECVTQNHGCQHDCINTLGGYECSCHIGYELHSDKKHCEDACGGVIEYPNGTITSPSFPDKYPMLKECIWEIIAPPKHKISLNFTHFDLEGTIHQQSDCGYDSVTIYSKLSENRLKRIGTYCGSSIPPTATSEGNALRVEFHSDKSVQHSGFAAVFFTDIDECSVNNGGCQHDCRNTIGSYVCSCHNGYSLHENGHDCKEGECKHEISAPFGTIYSPNYPDKYPPNMDCVWHFSTTPGHRIKLIFNEFNVEPHQECAYDNVAIYDGESESSLILGRFCGDKIPYPISSSTNQLYMVLKTDRNKERNGFTAVYSTSCGGYLRATNQIQQFYSHARFGNHNYDENMDCEWTIQAPLNSNVQLLFLTFDIESSDNCTYDYVQVFSGMEDTSGPMYGQYCGTALPQDIISLTDSLLVRFKTDSSVVMKGFSASYVAVDPFSDEDANEYSSEMVTPFPGSLKSIYKEDETRESDDYSDFSENHLIVHSPYSPIRRHQNRL